MIAKIFAVSASILALLAAGNTQAGELCRKFGPQAPRDITAPGGANPHRFSLALPAAELNLCDIHFHARAEHKGPGFSQPAGEGLHGFKCNGTGALTADELKAPEADICHGLRAGDSIEVHWVYTSCDVIPGPGLDSCMTPQCANPILRAEAQVFLLTNGRSGADFADFAYAGDVVDGMHQPRALPESSDEPIVFRGSTTGSSYSDEACSPLQVTLSVRPNCAKLDIGSLGRWCAANPFGEDHAHGVRSLVTAPELLSQIK